MILSITFLVFIFYERPKFPKYKNPNNKYQNPTEQIAVEKKDRLKIIKGLKE